MTSKRLNNAIILVSDITKGMKSIGSKSLLSIANNLSILEYQIQYLKKYYYPINIYLCTGFNHDKVSEITSKYKNIHYCYNENYETENQVGSLIQCISEYKITKNTLIFTNGFVPIEKISINPEQCSIDVTTKSTKIPFEIGTNAGNTPTYLFYGLPNKWTEYLHLNEISISYIHSNLTNNKDQYAKMFLFELINILIDNGIKVYSHSINKNLPLKVNSIKDINIAKKYYEKHLHNKIK